MPRSSRRPTSPSGFGDSQAAVQQALQRISQLGQAGNLAEAERQCRKLLKQHPNEAQAWHLLSVICLQQGQLEQGLAHIQRAIQLAPLPEFYSHAGVVQCSLGDLAAGITSYETALALQPQQPHTRYNLGLALQKANRLDEAEQTYLSLLAQQPHYATAHLQLGNLYQQQQQFGAAIAAYRQAIQQDANLAGAWCNLAVVWQTTGEIEQAQTAFQQALSLNPSYLEAHNGLGAVYEKQERAAEAIQSYRRALALQPDYLPALTNLANLYLRLEQFGPAAALFQQILQLQPQHGPTLDSYLKLLLTTCDWTDLPATLAAFQQALAADCSGLSPLNSLFLPLSAPQQLQIAQAQAATIAARTLRDCAQPTQERSGQKARIRLGYVSGDFRYHAVGQLILRLFELHDRQAFEVFAYSLGPEDNSFESQKLQSDCDCFRSLRGQSPSQIAQQVQQDQIDILIDLAGYTNYACPELFALRPAPLQVNYLGYPGTLGASYIDYIITDAILTPPELAPTLAETCLYLPDSYQLNCYPYPSPPHLPTPPSLHLLRSQHNLPPDAFVFCCFNKSQKLEPTTFAVWMRLLQQLPQSRLWLLSDHATVEANLQAEAQRQGVDPARLVFAPRVSKQAHLERHICADLFLDTPYYNAHVTASDALWAGTPVVTLRGQTFASRVGASLLTAAGLPELIAPDLAAYEQLALHLATHPSELQALKQRLQTRDSALFNTAQTVRHLEAGYRAIWQRGRAGLAPEVVRVERLPQIETPEIRVPEIRVPEVSPAEVPQVNLPPPETAQFSPDSFQVDQRSDQPSSGPAVARAHPVADSSTAITCRADAGFLDWISQAQGSLVVTTYQANRLLLIGWNGQQVTLLAREFVKPMGVAVAGNRLALSTQQAIRLFANAQPLAPDYLPQQPGRYDGLYLPRATYHTGDLYSHDLGFGQDGLWLVNTRFSCLASLSPEFSFLPRWHPAFITALTPEDRCHLNGLALVEGKPKYVTALGESDRAGGWRQQKGTGGLVIEVETDEIVLRGLSMPHSPRWHQGQLWLLNSGRGELWRIDPVSWRPEVVCALPGFGRGLALVGDFALVGLCQSREASLSDLPVQSRFEPLICGVAVVDLRRGVATGLLEFPTGCRELYDVQFLPSLLRPNLIDLDQSAAQEAFTTPAFAYWLREQADFNSSNSS